MVAAYIKIQYTIPFNDLILTGTIPILKISRLL